MKILRIKTRKIGAIILTIYYFVSSVLRFEFLIDMNDSYLKEDYVLLHYLDTKAYPHKISEIFSNIVIYLRQYMSDSNNE